MKLPKNPISPARRHSNVDINFVLINLAYILYLLSYASKKIYKLRVFSCLGSLTLIICFATRAEPLYNNIFWLSLFVLTNSVQLWRLYLESRPIQFSEEEQKLYQLVFRSLTPIEYKKLISLAKWKSSVPGEILVEAGGQADKLMLIYSGKVEVILKNKNVIPIYLTGGQFMGEMSFLTNKQYSARLQVVEETRYLLWTFKEFHKFLDDRPELNHHFKSVLGCDLVEKLRVG